MEELKNQLVLLSWERVKLELNFIYKNLEGVVFDAFVDEVKEEIYYFIEKLNKII